MVELTSSDFNEAGDIEPSFLLDKDISLVTPGDVDRIDMSLVKLDIMSDVSDVMEVWLFKL